MKYRIMKYDIFDGISFEKKTYDTSIQAYRELLMRNQVEEDSKYYIVADLRNVI